MFVSNCVPPLVKRYYSVFPLEIEQKRAYTLFRFNSCVSSFCPSYNIVFLVLVSLLNTIHVWMNNFKANSKSNSKGYKSTLCFYFFGIGNEIISTWEEWRVFDLFEKKTINHNQRLWLSSNESNKNNYLQSV